MDEFKLWLKLNEHIWLFWQLNIEIVLGFLTAMYVVREFHYDANKDAAKKQKKTRTTKKTTQNKNGQKVTEEVTEVSEPMPQQKED